MESMPTMMDTMKPVRPQLLSVASTLNLPRLSEVATWLKNYGFAGNVDGINTLPIFLTAVRDAAKFFGVTLPSDLGDPAALMEIIRVFRALMAIPRCGRQDIEQQAMVNGWQRMGVKTVLVRVVHTIPNMSRQRQEELTEAAIASWRNVCGVDVKMAAGTDSKAHVSISLCDRSSGSDGRGAMLAFTYLPTDWSKQSLPMPLLFDIAETFGERANGPTIGYQEVVAHELGHCLIGLTHAPQTAKALMAPFYAPGLMDPTSHDINRALQIWPIPPVAEPLPPVVIPGSPAMVAKIDVTYTDGKVITIPGTSPR